ncbi:MAG: DUF1844 domain-containing protein [Deltaproteobacteria bacterium]|nr:DUF1844 domain-containing protein [Deltaproteobacteria bacterium]
MADDPSNETTSGEGAAADPDVPIDFATFILSLSSSAAYHLGLAPHPEKETTCHNLPMAKQTIDILAVLQDKTKGNLTGEEERLLGEILYNLRMAFVRESNKCSSSS